MKASVAKEVAINALMDKAREYFNAIYREAEMGKLSITFEFLPDDVALVLKELDYKINVCVVEAKDAMESKIITKVSWLI